MTLVFKWYTCINRLFSKQKFHFECFIRL